MKKVFALVAEYNKEIQHLPPDPRNPQKIDSTILNDELLDDAAFWELEEFQNDELWARDVDIRRGVAALHESKRLREELDIILEQRQRYVNEHCTRLECLLALLGALGGRYGDYAFLLGDLSATALSAMVSSSSSKHWEKMVGCGHYTLTELRVMKGWFPL